MVTRKLAIMVAAVKAANAFAEAGLPRLTIEVYGCVECQRCHYEGDPLYAAHLCRQSKHGVTTAPFTYAIAAREGR